MRFQPSWVMESLPSGKIDSVFIPIASRAQPLLWFKRHGFKIFVNDPTEGGALLLRAFLQNQGELFSEENEKKFNRTIKKPFDIAMNPFKSWENRPFSREQLDYLFYWREAGFEIHQPMQRDLFWAAVYMIMNYWISVIKCDAPVKFTPYELMKHLFTKQKEAIFEGKESVFALNMPMDELGEEVEASLCLIPLTICDKRAIEDESEIYFHAWLKGYPEISSAKREIEFVKKNWFFSWDSAPHFENMLKKVGKSKYCGITWSGDDLPPRIHEENIAKPLIETFSPNFPKAKFMIKTAFRQKDDYDFLLIMGDNV